MFCWYVFGNISGGFRGISHFLGNFAGFRGNTWISRVRDRDRAKYQKPCSNETYNLGLLNREIQRVHTITHSYKRLTHTYPTSCWILPSHSLNIITSTFTFSHLLYVVLLCLNIDLSLLSYVLTRWKFAKWTCCLEPELSINVIVLYTVQSPLFFRKITENEC